METDVDSLFLVWIMETNILIAKLPFSLLIMQTKNHHYFFRKHVETKKQ